MLLVCNEPRQIQSKHLEAFNSNLILSWHLSTWFFKKKFTFTVVYRSFCLQEIDQILVSLAGLKQVCPLLWLCVAQATLAVPAGEGTRARVPWHQSKCPPGPVSPPRQTPPDSTCSWPCSAQQLRLTSLQPRLVSHFPPLPLPLSKAVLFAPYRSCCGVCGPAQVQSLITNVLGAQGINDHLL